MHCHLYRIRRRQRRANALNPQRPNNIGTKLFTLDDAMLERFPIRTYVSFSTNDQKKTISDQGDVRSEDIPSEVDVKNQSQEKTPDEASCVTIDVIPEGEYDARAVGSTAAEKPTVNRQASQSSMRSAESKLGVLSRKVSVRSTCSTKSKRSINAIAAAAALSEGAGVNRKVITQDPNHPYSTTCAICLEDFEAGDQLRALPCEHEYHSECIDPWLTEKSSLCPLCKFDCAPENKEADTRSMAFSEESGRNIYIGAMLTWWPIAAFRKWMHGRRDTLENNGSSELNDIEVQMIDVQESPPQGAQQSATVAGESSILPHDNTNLNQ